VSARDAAGTTTSDAAADDLDVRIVAGGALDAVEQAAIIAAVSRVARARAAEQSKPASAWALAGRLEASGTTTVRWRGALPTPLR
jgi:hypothetical protein